MSLKTRLERLAGEIQTRGRERSLEGFGEALYRFRAAARTTLENALAAAASGDEPADAPHRTEDRCAGLSPSRRLEAAAAEEAECELAR